MGVKDFLCNNSYHFSQLTKKKFQADQCKLGFLKKLAGSVYKDLQNRIQTYRPPLKCTESKISEIIKDQGETIKGDSSEIITRLPKTFKGNPCSYNTKTSDSKDPTIELTILNLILEIS